MTEKVFREFVALFKMWPVDATKGERCLGNYIRKYYNQHFKKGELSENIDVNHWNKVLTDLKAISDDVYLKKYPRLRATGSLGKAYKACLEYLYIFQKLKQFSLFN